MAGRINGIASRLYIPTGGRPRGVTLSGTGRAGGTLNKLLRSSLTAALLLAVASCAVPAGTAPASTGSAGGAASTPALASAGADATAALETFTFPDGHISFSYPAGWSVRTGEGPYLAEETKATSVEATVMDESGKEVARILSGLYGDGTAGPVERTVLDHAPVPGITDTAGKPAEFGFALDEIPGVDSYYFMDVRAAGGFLPDRADSGTNQVPLPNGMMAAYVVFDADPELASGTPDAGKAWMGTERYAQLRALLLSLKYT